MWKNMQGDYPSLSESTVMSNSALPPSSDTPLCTPHAAGRA